MNDAHKHLTAGQVRIIDAIRAIRGEGGVATVPLIAERVGLSDSVTAKRVRHLITLEIVVGPGKGSREGMTLAGEDARPAARGFDPMHGVVNRREATVPKAVNGRVTKPAPERQHEAKRRKCLMCRREFKSEWPGHRVCGDCKQTDAWASGDAVHVGGLL